jgi:citronellol/citronellal dehydrogenase
MSTYRSVFQAGLFNGQVALVTGGGSGIGRCTLATISAKGWDAVVRNNLTGGFLMARECATQWMSDHGGGIVNIIADIWGGMPGMGHSGAARAGMLNFTETAALEWAPIRVNAVAPGWIASSGMDQYPPEMRATIRGMTKLVPLQRLGTESEVAAAIVFLLSPAAAFISGACLRVDGAAPNAKRIWPAVGTGGSTEAFNGFHLATTPKVLQG